MCKHAIKCLQMTNQMHCREVQNSVPHFQGGGGHVEVSPRTASCCPKLIKNGTDGEKQQKNEIVCQNLRKYVVA